MVTVAGEKPFGPYVTLALIGAPVVSAEAEGEAAATAPWGFSAAMFWVGEGALGRLLRKYHPAPKRMRTMMIHAIVDVFIQCW